MKKIIDCETNKPIDPQIGYVDGYDFGDRLLEGVMFEITLENGEPICKGVAPDAVKYCSKFSKKQMNDWCKAAVEIAYDCLVSLNGRDLMIEEI